MRSRRTKTEERKGEEEEEGAGGGNVGDGRAAEAIREKPKRTQEMVWYPGDGKGATHI